MRHILTGILFVSFFGLYSCNKGGDDLEGTWQLSQLEGFGSSFLSFPTGEPIPVYCTLEGCDLGYLLTFNEDELSLTTDGQYSIKYTSALINDTTVHTIVYEDNQITSSYTENESEIMSDKPLMQFKLPSAIGEQFLEITTVAIVELSEDELVLRHKREKTEEIPAGSLDVSIDVITTWIKN